jgi:hypothetical protein
MKLSGRGIYFVLLYFFVFLFLTQCKVRDKGLNKGKLITIENFDDFYSKFHSDSIFQMSRIKFPLKGKQIDGDGERGWSKEKWVLFKTPIYKVDTLKFRTEYKKTKTMFKEKVWIESSGFSFECRFELIDSKWYLVYALDMNL